MIFKSVNYQTSEFKLNIKALLRQEFTLEEMKNSNIYEAYKKITTNTNIEEIDGILNKKSTNFAETIYSWHFPYGYISVFVSKDEEPRILNKMVQFKTPNKIQFDEKQLKFLLECDSLQEIINNFGESAAMVGESYETKGKTTVYSYEWQIKTSYLKEFITAIEKFYDDYINHSLNNNGAEIWAFRHDKNMELRVPLKNGAIAEYNLTFSEKPTIKLRVYHGT